MKTIKDLSRIAEKKTRTIVGMMSGTSLDGLDISLMQIKGSGTRTRIVQSKNYAFPLPPKLKEMLLRNSQVNGGSVTEICKLNFMIARLYAKAVNRILLENNLKPDDIDLIGSHGQTIHHLPLSKRELGMETTSTLQIGDPAVLAKLTGCIVVGDFRTGDMALGGQGAPLIPYFDFVMCSSNKADRGLLNIGGISNISVIPKNCNPEDVSAFDTGPGNMIIDYAVQRLFQKPYDKNGKIAKRGKVQEQIINYLGSTDINLNQKPPKSTGREFYGEKYCNALLKKFKNVPAQDIVASATYYTAWSVQQNYEKYILPKTKINELIISGGGSRNETLLQYFKSLFGSEISIMTSSDIGVDPDFKEALCFGIYANELIIGNPITIPKVTGASRSTLSGKICLP